MRTTVKLFTLPAICFLLVNGCSSQSPKAPSIKGKVKWSAGKCLGRTHPEKTETVGDYQACSHNHNRVKEDVNACMIKHGWSEMKEEKCSDFTSHTRKEIKACLRYSTTENVVSHDKMNECMSKHTARKLSIEKINVKVEELILKPD